MFLRCLAVGAAVLVLGAFAGEAQAQKLRINKSGGLVAGRRPGLGRYAGARKIIANAFRASVSMQKNQLQALQKLQAQQLEAQKLLAEKRLKQKQAAADAARAAKERERERVKARLANGGSSPAGSKEKKKTDASKPASENSSGA